MAEKDSTPKKRTKKEKIPESIPQEMLNDLATLPLEDFKPAILGIVSELFKGLLDTSKRVSEHGRFLSKDHAKCHKTISKELKAAGELFKETLQRLAHLEAAVFFLSIMVGNLRGKPINQAVIAEFLSITNLDEWLTGFAEILNGIGVEKGEPLH